MPRGEKFSEDFCGGKQQTMGFLTSSLSSLLVIGLAVVVYYSVTDPIQGGHKQLFPNGHPQTPLPSFLSVQQRQDYHRDGFLLIRQLVHDHEELESLQLAANQIYHSWSIFDLLFSSYYAKLSFQVWRYSRPFAQLAFESAVPSFSAQLLQEQEGQSGVSSTATTTSVRILKDALFAYSPTGNKGCGYHQDDRGFWPVSDDTTGVNLWLALSSVTAKQGGGIRVVNQSLVDADTAESCLEIIRVGLNTTCSMETLSPDCHARLDAASISYDVEPGDALIWDRRTFHRSDPFKMDDDDHDNVAITPKLRYTLRYIPGHAEAEGKDGFLHPSVETGEKFISPYYPQVWPKTLPDEMSSVQMGLDSDWNLVASVKKMLQLLSKESPVTFNPTSKEEN